MKLITNYLPTLCQTGGYHFKKENFVNRKQSERERKRNDTKKKKRWNDTKKIDINEIIGGENWPEN